jgi:hypothetical protein
MKLRVASRHRERLRGQDVVRALVERNLLLRHGLMIPDVRARRVSGPALLSGAIILAVET